MVHLTSETPPPKRTNFLSKDIYNQNFDIIQIVWFLIMLKYYSRWVSNMNQRTR